VTSADAGLVARAVLDAVENKVRGEGRHRQVDSESLVRDLEYELERIGYEIRRKP